MTLLLSLDKGRAKLTKKKPATKETPLMRQYNQIKAKHPDAMLLFRVGDFYETFGSDAVKAAEILGIVLTKRKNGSASHIELAGFPHHSLDSYLPKLVRAGLRVAICDQLEDPKATKTIVKRGVTELVTPGVTLNDKVLDNRSNNFLASIIFDKKQAGLALLDVSTGEFYVSQGKKAYIEKLIDSLQPSEVLYSRSQKSAFQDINSQKAHSFVLDEWIFEEDFATELILNHFEVRSLKGFGISNWSLGIRAAGGIFHYLKETNHHQLKHINQLSRIEEDNYVWLDGFTIGNLELFGPKQAEGKGLIDIIDMTTTAMGSRTMKRWLALPLKDEAPIKKRHEAVSYFLKNEDARMALISLFKNVGDVERLISKVAVKKITPRETKQLQKALDIIPSLKETVSKSKVSLLTQIGEQLNTCDALRNRIDSDISEEAPHHTNKGGIFNEGVNEKLDEYRNLSKNGKNFLLQIQQREQENTGIPSLKIGFNNVFGYYLEVTNTHKSKVPESWIRKQTLTNAERYITEELKEYESKILGAEEHIKELEQRIFEELIHWVSEYIPAIQLNAQLMGQVDCFLSFASVADQYNYVKPEVNNSFEINISEARHPVIERNLPMGESYIPNDVFMNNDQQQVLMITGPNMSGKSALLRQTALVVIMAQIGSFVPAKSAQIGIVDKIFTRVGASDNLSLGESTFMVEMNETASILNNVSDRSLIILDEIGRGTSTYDGISIAWAIAEYLHDSKERPKTLFATHYHELNEMSKTLKRIKNFNVSIKEFNKKIVFLRKLAPGGSNHSFGIHVAKMAGIPIKVVKRANEIMEFLEETHSNPSGGSTTTKPPPKPMQMSFFQLDDPTLSHIKDEILKTDIDTLTPVEALMKLHEIKKTLGA